MNEEKERKREKEREKEMHERNEPTTARIHKASIDKIVSPERNHNTRNSSSQCYHNPKAKKTDPHLNKYTKKTEID